MRMVFSLSTGAPTRAENDEGDAGLDPTSREGGTTLSLESTERVRASFSMSASKSFDGQSQDMPTTRCSMFLQHLGQGDKLFQL
jgi:hypothetical protein